MIVPALPPLDPALLAAHERAHAGLAERLRSADAEAVRVFVAFQRRVVVEALAYVQPGLTGATKQLLLPPPRAFLAPLRQRRMAGSEVALRYIDSGVAMRRSGVTTPAIDEATPCVLHALLEEFNPTDRETNPGMLRGMPTAWKPEVSDYIHPSSDLVPLLVEAALDVATNAPAPAAARAAWLTYVMLCIHPFVDGNGRTSRALYMAAVADELPLGIDWGALEQWSARRSEYIDALQAGQRTPEYEPERMDGLPFMQFATHASIDGVEVCMQRLDAISERLGQLSQARRLEPRAAAVMMLVDLLRSASLVELGRLELPRAEVLALVRDLIDAGHLVWRRRRASRRTLFDDAEWALCAVAR